MIALKVSFHAGQIEDFKKLAREFPKEADRANARAASTVRARFRRVMRDGGGTDGVPAFIERSAETMLMHPGTRPSGHLADREKIVMYRQNGMQFVGWVGTLNAWAVSYQTECQREFGDIERRYLYHLMNQNHHSRENLPSYYHRPERPVVQPLADDVAKVYPSWVLKNFENLLRAKLARIRGEK